jgi:hypothetical protein
MVPLGRGRGARFALDGPAFALGYGAMSGSETLAELLERTELFGAGAVATLLSEAQSAGIHPLRLAVTRGLADDARLADTLAQLTGWPRLNLGRTAIDPRVQHLAAPGWVEMQELCLLSLEPVTGALRVAALDPTAREALGLLARRTGLEVRASVASARELDALRGAAQAWGLGAAEAQGEAGLLAELEVLFTAQEGAAHALQAVFELCIARGLIDREEYLLRLAQLPPDPEPLSGAGRDSRVAPLARGG